MDAAHLLKLLEKQGVKFGRMQEGAAKRILPLVVFALPFIYLALAWKMVSSMYNPKVAMTVRCALFNIQ